MICGPSVSMPKFVACDVGVGFVWYEAGVGQGHDDAALLVGANAAELDVALWGWATELGYISQEYSNDSVIALETLWRAGR